MKTWIDIPGWFDWRNGQKEAVDHFPSGSRFLELGLYLGQSVCSLSQLVKESGKQITVVGVDTCTGTGPEGGDSSSIPRDHHCEAVQRGQGTFAGELHRNLIECGLKDTVSLLVTDSASAAILFPDEWFDWINVDAAHDYLSVSQNIREWLPKLKPGGWLTGDDLCPGIWDGVVQAVNELLPTATKWSHDSWRFCKPFPHPYPVDLNGPPL